MEERREVRDTDEEWKRRREVRDTDEEWKRGSRVRDTDKGHHVREEGGGGKGNTDTRDVKEDKGGEGYRRGMEERWEVGGYTRGMEERRGGGRGYRHKG
jgi:hypothetical protein